MSMEEEVRGYEQIDGEDSNSWLCQSGSSMFPRVRSEERQVSWEMMWQSQRHRLSEGSKASDRNSRLYSGRISADGYLKEMWESMWLVFRLLRTWTLIVDLWCHARCACGTENHEPR